MSINLFTWFFASCSSCHWIVLGLLTLWTYYHGWYSYSHYSSKGSIYFVKEDAFISFYIYIQAWLLFQGIQFSTDHWDDPFLSSVCVSVYMSPSSPLSDSLTVCLSVLRPSVCLFCVYVIFPKIEVFWNIYVPCARSALFFALAKAHAKNPDPFCKFPWRLVWRKTECQLSWEAMRVSSRTAMPLIVAVVSWKTVFSALG